MPRVGRQWRRWGAVLAAAVVAWGLARATRAPLLSADQFSRAVYDRHGTLLRLTLSNAQTYRVFTRLEDMSPAFVTATLDYEDKHFYRHFGVNPVALVKAFAFTYVSHTGRRGGSTITMQLARVKWGIDSRTVGGKLKQIARAVELELLYSKHDILEAYLNVAPYGGNVEGVGAASLVYFHRQPNALALPEAMALAVMPQSPTRRTPGSTVEPPALKAARLKLAAISLAEHPTLKPETLALETPLTLFTTRDLPFMAPHAVERALTTQPEPSMALTIDEPLQAQLERLVAQYVARRDGAGIHNAALMVVDVETSEVLAHVGSADFFNAAIHGQVDAATAPRSPGSALKPLVYARALDEGLIHPRTLLKDVPMRFGSYNPENFDTQYLGPMSATEALVRSRNVPAVELNVRLQHGLHGVLSDVHLKGLEPAEHYGAGIVLGAVEVSMEELIQLYVALAHGGRWSPLQRVLPNERSAPRELTPLVSPEAAELTLAMLASDDSGFEQWATARDAVTVSWKTGTSHAFRDAWTVGVVGRYALAVWVGNFDGTPNPSFVGRAAAAPLFFEVVGALRGRVHSPEGQRHAPKVDLVEAEVCAVSGKRPGPHCRHVVKTKVIPGRSPIDACDVHRVVHVDRVTGLRHCHAIDGVTTDEVYEVWPSDIAQLFGLAGLSRKPVPAPAEPCDADGDDGSLATATRAPRILSPQAAVTYHLRRDLPSQSQLPLLAHTDGSSHALTWFAGKEMIGTVAPGQSLEWSAPSGQYELRAVDDLGHASHVTVTIRWVDDPVAQERRPEGGPVTRPPNRVARSCAPGSCRAG